MAIKSPQQNALYKAAIAQAYSQPVGDIFSFNQLVKLTGNYRCSTNDQREAGRRFTAWVKNCSSCPLVIVEPKTPIKYQKIK